MITIPFLLPYFSSLINAASLLICFGWKYGQVETLKSYKGDHALLGPAEDFFMRLLEVKQYVPYHCHPPLPLLLPTPASLNPSIPPGIH